MKSHWYRRAVLLAVGGAAAAIGLGFGAVSAANDAGPTGLTPAAPSLATDDLNRAPPEPPSDRDKDKDKDKKHKHGGVDWSWDAYWDMPVREAAAKGLYKRDSTLPDSSRIYFDGRPHNDGYRPATIVINVVTVFNVDVFTVQNALLQGNSLAGIGAQHGMTRDGVIFSVLNDVWLRLQLAVSNGWISQGDANVIFIRIQTNIWWFIDQPYPFQHLNLLSWY